MSSRMDDDADRCALCPACGSDDLEWIDCDACFGTGKAHNPPPGHPNCQKCKGNAGWYKCALGCPSSISGQWQNEAAGRWSTAGGNDPFETVANPVNFADPANWTPPPASAPLIIGINVADGVESADVFSPRATAEGVTEILDFRLFGVSAPPTGADAFNAFQHAANDMAAHECPHGCAAWAREAADHLTRHHASCPLYDPADCLCCERRAE